MEEEYSDSDEDQESIYEEPVDDSDVDADYLPDDDGEGELIGGVVAVEEEHDFRYVTSQMDVCTAH